MKKILATTLMAGALMAAPSAHALKIYDGWQIDTNAGTSDSLTTNIGHLVLGGGIATITQEVDGSGNPYVGAAFSEYGNVFSVNFVRENSAGAGDAGFLRQFNNGLNFELVFTGLSGVISSVSGTGINFSFSPNIGDIFLRAVDSNGDFVENLAEFEVAAPSGGSLGNFNGAANTLGTSNVLGLVKSSTTMTNLFRDSLGNSLDLVSLLGNLFLEVDTTNSISRTSTPVVGGCDLNGDGNFTGCATIQATSEGAANLFTVPEPASLALLGMGLLGFGAARRKQA